MEGTHYTDAIILQLRLLFGPNSSGLRRIMTVNTFLFGRVHLCDELFLFSVAHDQLFFLFSFSLIAKVLSNVIYRSNLREYPLVHCWALTSTPQSAAPPLVQF